MEQILAIFESPQESPKVVVSSESSKKRSLGRDETGFKTTADIMAKPIQVSPPEYDLYITNSRFICAVVWDEATDVPTDASLEYEAAVHQSYSPTKQERRASHKGKTPDEIAVMHPKSQSIPFDEVDWVKIKKSFFGAHVEIKAPSKEKKPFKIPIQKKRYNEAKSILNDHLGSKLL